MLRAGGQTFSKGLFVGYDRSDFRRLLFGLMVFLSDGVVILAKLDRRFFNDERGVLGFILGVDIETHRLGVRLLVLPGVIS